MGNSSVSYSPPKIPGVRDFRTLKESPIIPLRVVSRPLNNSDPRQQWQMVLSPDKKTFQLKNIQNHKYLYVGLEPESGIAQFSTIDLDNNNYLSDLAFSGINNNILNLNTSFTFISSFGTQLNIVDNANEKIEKSGGSDLPYINSKRVRITASNKQFLSINAIFIYNSKGIVINKNRENAYSKTEDQNTLASTVIDNVNKNSERRSLDATNNNPLKTALDPNSKFISKSDDINDQWWEYRFDDLIDVAMVEIFGNGKYVKAAYSKDVTGDCQGTGQKLIGYRHDLGWWGKFGPIYESYPYTYTCVKDVIYYPTEYSYANLNNIRIDLFNNNATKSTPVWTKSIPNKSKTTTDNSPDTHKVIQIQT